MNWLYDSLPLWTTLAVISAVMLVVGIVLLPWLLALIPEDYFLTHEEYFERWKTERPILRLIALTLRNLLGGVLILLGVIMLVTPGQGLVTILLGLACSTFPGKRHLELKILKQRGVSRSIDWLRAKMKRPPLKLPDDERPASTIND